MSCRPMPAKAPITAFSTATRPTISATGLRVAAVLKYVAQFQPDLDNHGQAAE